MALKKLLIFGDVHLPYHDPIAIDLLGNVASVFAPDVVINLGDTFDFLGLSVHEKNPSRLNSLSKELDIGAAFLDMWKGVKRKVWLDGNHEYRLTRCIRERLPEFSDLISLDRLLPASTLKGWERVPYRQDIRIGKVYYCHDIGATGRYGTFKTYDTYHHSVVHAHSHRVCMMVENDAVGDSHLAASFGWLGDPSEVDWLYRAKVTAWAQGFGVGYLDTTTGYTYLTPVPIVNRTCCVEGRVFRV